MNNFCHSSVALFVNAPRTIRDHFHCGFKGGRRLYCEWMEQQGKDLYDCVLHLIVLIFLLITVSLLWNLGWLTFFPP